MSYVAPYMDSAGLHIPTYIDIRDDLIIQAKNIFGSDFYLENDSMDYQYISAIALKIYDDLSSIQLAYNNRGPATAIGTGLDSVIKLNGLVRKVASYSSCPVTITGTAGTIIINGSVKDTSGNVWDLPASVTIGETGTIIVTAVCTVLGAIVALAGNINQINTPTKGWVSVTNVSAAVVGNPIETDAEVRARQAISTELPSQTLLTGTNAGVLSVSGVNRCKVYENDTNTTDSDGLPAHSITAVVEGGADADIAQQIFERKGIGGYTNGTTSVDITDTYGQITTIRFERPSYIDIYATINIKTHSGYSIGTDTLIQSTVNTYLNSLDIGGDVYLFGVYGVISDLLNNLKIPTFSVTSLTIGTTLGGQSTNDVVVAYNEISQSDITKIVVNVS